MKRTPLAALAATLLAATAAIAGDATAISIDDPYARASRPDGPTGAAFMTIINSAEVADRLVAARSDAAERVELHTHLEDANGVMRMVEVEDGFLIPANGRHDLARGGDHIMFMGLRQPFTDGATVEVTLSFERAGDITIAMPVDLDRMPEGHGGPGGMN